MATQPKTMERNEDQVTQQQADTKEREANQQVTRNDGQDRQGRELVAGDEAEVTPFATVQGTYATRMRAGVPGLMQGSDYDTDTGNCETAAGIGFGLAVSQGVGNKGCILGGTLAGFRGATVRDVTVPATATMIDKYPQYKNMAVMVRGMMYVRPATGITIVPNGPVHFDGTTGVFTNTGGIGPIKGARWVTKLDGDVAIMELAGYNQD